MMSSPTSAPESITFLAARPSGVPALTAARSMSPVEICGMPNFWQMKAACVPLPAPGAPKQNQSHARDFTHGLEILRGIHTRRDLRFADRYCNAETVPEHAQPLQRFRLLQRRRLQARVLLEETDAVAVDAGVPVAGGPSSRGYGIREREK